jgi:hypothetical protein
MQRVISMWLPFWRRLWRIHDRGRALANSFGSMSKTHS